jgi:hypothetical protein
MVGMGVIEADDLLAALAAVALNVDEFPGIDTVAIVKRVRSRVAAAGNARNGPRAVVFEVSQQNPTAFVGIGFLPVLTKGDVGGLGHFQHRKVRAQRREIRCQIPEGKIRGIVMLQQVK